MRRACFLLALALSTVSSCLGALSREAVVSGKPRIPRKFVTEDYAEDRAHALSSTKRVKIGFYSESLCPYCRQFTSELLAPMFTNGLSRIAEIDYYPFGNARYNETGGLDCQHGELECQLNKVFACALHYYPRQEDWFPFVSCVEKQDPDDMMASLSECSKEPTPQLSLDKIMDCTQSHIGDDLLKALGDKTDKLVPAHQWVPWVTVNGVPLWEDNDNLWQYVCAAYDGERPPVCFEQRKASAAIITAEPCLRQGAEVIPKRGSPCSA